MILKESTTLIRDGYRYKHTKCYSVVDDEGYTLKRFNTLNEAKAFITDYKRKAAQNGK